MKTIVLLVLLILSGNIASAKTSDLFEYDESQIQQEFSELEALENQVIHRTNYKRIESQCLFKSKSDKTEFYINPLHNSDFPAFCCGCCLGPCGVVLVVIISDGDSEQVLQSIIGCMVPTAISITYSIFKEFWWTNWW